MSGSCTCPAWIGKTDGPCLALHADPEPDPVEQATPADVRLKTGKKHGEKRPRSSLSQPTRRTAAFPANYVPKKTARRHRSKYLRRSIVAGYLRKVLLGLTPIQVDFDLAVAFFLQETAHLKLGAIPKSVNAVVADFSLLEPCTGRQDDIYECALEIQAAVEFYKLHPDTEKPFALRFPTLKKLHLLTIQRAKNPVLVGKDEAVILIDKKERVLALGIPPKVPPTLLSLPTDETKDEDLTPEEKEGAQEREEEDREKLGGEVRPLSLFCQCLNPQFSV